MTSLSRGVCSTAVLQLLPFIPILKLFQVCIVVGVDSEHSSPGSLDPYPSGSAMGFINYASTDPACIKSVFSTFMEYLPYIMLVETLILVVVEKFTFKIPRIAQKVERFYQNIVEQVRLTSATSALHVATEAPYFFLETAFGGICRGRAGPSVNFSGQKLLIFVLPTTLSKEL